MFILFLFQKKETSLCQTCINAAKWDMGRSDVTHSWALVQERERKGVCRPSMRGSALHGTQSGFRFF